eukprot:1613484-Pyramimonas_sp.AAC.1
MRYVTFWRFLLCDATTSSSKLRDGATRHVVSCHTSVVHSAVPPKSPRKWRQLRSSKPPGGPRGPGW